MEDLKNELEDVLSKKNFELLDCEDAIKIKAGNMPQAHGGDWCHGAPCSNVQESTC